MKFMKKQGGKSDEILRLYDTLLVDFRSECKGRFLLVIQEAPVPLLAAIIFIDFVSK